MKKKLLRTIYVFYVLYFAHMTSYAQHATFVLAAQLAQLDSLQTTDLLAKNLLKTVSRFENINKMLNDSTLWDANLTISWDDMGVWAREYECRSILESLKPNYSLAIAYSDSNNLANLIYTRPAALKHLLIPNLSANDRLIYNKKLRESTGSTYSSRSMSNERADAPMETEKPRFAGLPSEQQLILATASFIAERFKTELNMRFLESMQHELADTPLRLAFPNTHNILNINALTHYQTLSVSIRTAFEQDFQSMPNNLLEMLNDSAQGLHRYLNTAEQKDGLRMVSSMLELFNGLRKGDDLLSGLDIIANRYNSWSNNAFDRQINVVNLLLKNFPTVSLEQSDFFQKIANPLIFKYFFALIFHQNELLFQSMGLHSAQLKQQTHLHFNRWQQSFQLVRRVQRQINLLNHQPNPKAQELVQYIESLIDLIGSTQQIIQPQNPVFKQPYLDLAQKAVQIYEAMERHEYGLVINHTLMIIKAFAPDTVQKLDILNFQLLKKKRENYDALVSRCSFYGSFMIDFLAAKTEAQLKNVLSNYALPPGSYSIKRRSAFNISLNAYAGGMIGQEFIDKKDLLYPTRWTTAFSAPIGLDLSWGLRNGTSLSIFASMVDLGAVVSFRLNDPQTEPLPELSFKNVIAPGFYVLYGLKKMPISIGATLQLAPRLRNYTATQQDIHANMAYRYGVVALVDIPIFNIYNRPKILNK